jgi:hypothetical protein
MPDGPTSLPDQLMVARSEPSARVVSERSEIRGHEVTGLPVSSVMLIWFDVSTGLPARSVTVPAGISRVSVPFFQVWFSRLNP